ncbi:MAG: dehydrogenase [Planctomycetales bacterium]|nr:dehydrogenase [Planctomycetales bacterium]
MHKPFRLGLTRDFLKPDGSLGFGDIGLDVLAENSQIEREFLPDYGQELPAEVANQFDALLVLAPRVTAATLENCDRLAIVARFGVGYDNVDVPACTRNSVLLTITPAGVRRPVAVSALTLLLALSHKLLAKDRMTREGRWHEKLDQMGVGLTGRTLGLIGLGNIGREILHIVAPLDMRHVAFDPFVSPDAVRASGVELLGLESLLEQSDFVCVCCALTPDTHHLLNHERLARMKPTSFLINVARGPIVDQQALTALLRDRRIAGAALDVFEKEPIDVDDPLLGLDNVILSPHAICWTDELFRGNGQAACRSILDVASGRVPQDVVNRDVLAQTTLQQKLARFAQQGGKLQ